MTERETSARIATIRTKDIVKVYLITSRLAHWSSKEDDVSDVFATDEENEFVIDLDKITLTYVELQ